MFFDPGDNAIAVGRAEHRWRADPGETPLHFGKRRPTIILDAANTFTVCGAVVVSPLGDARASEPVQAFIDGMPDLTQAIHHEWPGLCGPASAANVIYAIGLRRSVLVEDLPRGPSSQADAAVARLIAGVNGEMNKHSLAAKMGLGIDGRGVTSDGMRRGLSDWLSARDPQSWKVDLDWFDDREKDTSSQSKFFQRLQAESRSGGGSILCLWPGSDFADGSTADAIERALNRTEGVARAGEGDRERSPAESAAALPGAGAGGRPIGLPGKKASQTVINTALRQGELAIDRARKAIEKSDEVAAADAVRLAITMLRPHAAGSIECRGALAGATELAERESRSGSDASAIVRAPTTFE